MLNDRRADAREFGQESERLAERYLRRKGYDILERNVQFPEGELDLVAKQGEVIVFVEVKARRSTAMGGAAYAVQAEKRTRLIRVAARYLAEHNGVGASARFDVVLIQQDGAGQPAVEHIENAFEVPAGDQRW
ncbi:MAG: YraN family protein [Nitrospiraceae bacterium]